MTTEQKPDPPADLDCVYLDQVRSLIGRGLDQPGFDAPAPVSEAVIRQMVDAVGDRNPIYTDAASARSTLHGGMVAPPLWLYGWMMAGLGMEGEEAVLEDGTRLFRAAPGGQKRSRPAQPTVRDQVNQVLESRGFASPVVTDMSYTFERYLRPGERPRFSSWIVDDIVGPKTTRIGVGFFVSLRLEVYVGEERVASMVQRYLRVRPHSAGGAVRREPQPVPESSEPPIASWRAVPGDAPQTRRFETIRVGEQLPELVVEVSPTLIIAGALASQDFQDVHHDFRMIGERGHPTVFMNMMTISGLVGRFVTDWTGPDCIIRSHTLRLGRPNYAGDKLRLSATATQAAVQEGCRRVKLEFLGRNGLGQAIDGDVVVEFPR